MVELQAADPRQAVPLGIEEHVLEERFGRVLGGGGARAHLLVDLLQGLFPGLDLVRDQTCPDGAVGVLDREDGKPFDILLPKRPEDFRRDLLAALDHDLSGRGVCDVGDDHLADEIVRGQ